MLVSVSVHACEHGFAGLRIENLLTSVVHSPDAFDPFAP